MPLLGLSLGLRRGHGWLLQCGGEANEFVNFAVSRPAFGAQTESPIGINVKAWRTSVEHNLPPVRTFGCIHQLLDLLAQRGELGFGGFGISLIFTDDLLYLGICFALVREFGGDRGNGGFISREQTCTVLYIGKTMKLEQASLPYSAFF